MIKRLGIWLILIVIAFLGLIFSTRYFLQPLNSDLSIVGDGKPSLILAYENYSPDSGAALNQLTKIKEDYQDFMSFAVADLGTPQGMAFAQQHNLINGAAVFLSATGEPIRITMLSSDEQALREILNQKLSMIGIQN